MSKSKIILGLVVIGAIYFCFALINASAPEKTTGTIEMVQPCGWFWCAEYDAHYAQEVNVPNSQANENNSESNLNNAQATQISSNTVKSQALDKFGGFLSGVCFIGAFLVIGLFTLFSFRNRVTS